MKHDIKVSAEQAVQAASLLVTDEAIEFIDKASTLILQTYEQSGKILIAGNGGSLCDALHFAEELTGFYREKRKALPAIALADPAHISCVANDLSYQDVFSRYLEALAAPKDLFVFMTTSGNSPNIIKAVSTAQQMGLKTIGFLGKDGGKLKGRADLEWIVSGFKYSDRIQEAHMSAIHIIIEILEKKLAQKEQMLSKPSLLFAAS
jgi:D-sedoheptulose 7-phosphate isomerase